MSPHQLAGGWTCGDIRSIRRHPEYNNKLHGNSVMKKHITLFSVHTHVTMLNQLITFLEHDSNFTHLVFLDHPAIRDHYLPEHGRYETCPEPHANLDHLHVVLCTNDSHDEIPHRDGQHQHNPLP